MAITYVKDIPDFNKKVEDVTNINELELTVNQLSASMLEVQGDVTELELTVSQLSASMLDVQGDVSTLAGAVTTISNKLDNPIITKTNSNISVTHGTITKLVETDDYLPVGKYIIMYNIGITDSTASIRNIACQIRVNNIVASESVLNQNEYSALRMVGCIIANIETANTTKGFIEFYLNSLDLTVSRAEITIIKIP